ncbi:MAG TPA: hypothetical protein VNA04_04240, partial [Thermoanaerobaculia bacterium]|nr:hypothetical protein [Thermoanaerobaculia bacterium]
MEERRLILAVALSLLVLTAYQLLFPPSSLPPASPPASTPMAPAVAPATPEAPPAAGPAVQSSSAPGAPVAPPVADEEERRVELEASDLELVFTNKGARLLSWQLLEFKDRRG